MNNQSQPSAVYADALDFLSLAARDVFQNARGQNIREGAMVNTPKGLGLVLALMNPRESVQGPSALVTVNGQTARYPLDDLDAV